MKDRLARIDLNLLVALHALIQERNVTRAAARLCVTTSAMSKTLNRLKDVLGDPLFERGPHGLILTQRVEELAHPVAKMLADVNHMVFSEALDPTDFEDTIHIAMPEIFAVQIIAPLLRCFSAKAPKLRLATRNVDDDYMDMLFAGHLDYVLYQEDPIPGLSSIPMGWHYPVLTMRTDHPLASSKSISPECLYAFPHIIYNCPKTRYHEFDFYYTELKKSSNPVLETNQLFTAIEMLLTTDSVMIGSETPFSTVLCGSKLASRPLSAVPGFDTIAAHMHLTFHERQKSAILHDWFIAQLMPICAAALPKMPVEAKVPTKRTISAAA